jgi:TM2 domain-containing membrane protein YozV
MTDPYDPYRNGDPEPYQVSGVPIGPPTVPYPAGYPANPYGPQFSDKSKVTAGLLQLLLGVFFTLGGVGRLYAGQTALGVIQICASVFAWVSFGCGFLLLFPFLIWMGIWVWFVIDGIIMLAGNPVDGQGRPLRR